MALGSAWAAHELSALSTAGLDDLDREAFDGFLHARAARLLERSSLEAVAVKLGLAAKTSGTIVPTAAGMLMFGELPQLSNPHWGVSAVEIRGRTMADPIAARADLEGPIPSLLDQALAFVDAHSRSAQNQVTDAGQAPDTTREYPPQALREILLNALLHRDLKLTSRVAVRLFDDRLEVWSPGGALGPLAPLDELAQDGGVSMPRNPVLAATARWLGLGEQLGRGLPLLRRVVSQATGQDAEIHGGASEVLVVIPSGLRAAPQVTALS